MLGPGSTFKNKRKELMPGPGFKPGLLRPQRSVLTTRRSRRATEEVDGKEGHYFNFKLKKCVAGVISSPRIIELVSRYISTMIIYDRYVNMPILGQFFMRAVRKECSFSYCFQFRPLGVRLILELPARILNELHFTRCSNY